MDGHVDGVTFPVASPQVMSVARTFWEKATATHVYCVQGRIRGERYARHWHDLAAIMRSAHFDAVISDRAVGRTVAEHKSCFFSEKDASGDIIDYFTAVEGALQIVPEVAQQAGNTCWAETASAAFEASLRRQRANFSTMKQGEAKFTLEVFLLDVDSTLNRVPPFRDQEASGGRHETAFNHYFNEGIPLKEIKIIPDGMLVATAPGPGFKYRRSSTGRQATRTRRDSSPVSNTPASSPSMISASFQTAASSTR